MINWTHQQRTYPQWQAGQMSNQSTQYALPSTSLGNAPPATLAGDDDGDYFYTITNW